MDCINFEERVISKLLDNDLVFSPHLFARALECLIYFVRMVDHLDL